MAGQQRGVVSFEGLRMDCNTYEAYRGGREMKLSRTDWDLLEFFVRNPRQVLTRFQIYHRVWGKTPKGKKSNLVDFYIHRLRKQMEAGDEPRLLHAAQGRGYVLRLPRPKEVGK